MKSFLFILALIPSSFAFGQNQESKFYQIKSHTIIEVQDSVAYLYFYQVYPSNMAYVKGGYEVKDTLYVNAPNEYANQDFQLITDVSHATLLTKETGKRKEMKSLDPIATKAYLISDYIKQKEIELSRDVLSVCPYANMENAFMICKGYYHGHGTFVHEKTTKDYASQRNTIDQEFLLLKDSLIQVHSVFTERTNEYIEHISEADVESIAAFLKTIPSFADHGYKYMKVVLESIAEQKPELYYQLLESITENRRTYYEILDRKHVRLLKAVKTSSPIKKELLKRRRRNVFLAIGLGVGTIAWDGAIIWGVVWLVRH